MIGNFDAALTTFENDVHEGRTPIRIISSAPTGTRAPTRGAMHD